jgi:hypothetical protein
MDFLLLIFLLFCEELITCSEESYRLWYAIVCDLGKKHLVNDEAKAH